eukprot:TRINITY_DN31277_c0_g2_i1.p1 TRINITY_DN31277_c0_g2~~TRINITY_DN31277_c0_g2_i1.p1  ORF type:complete len:348 (+),score=110.79 TRINITY_DN31277_c0_g2_i1:125-1168(+)
MIRRPPRSTQGVSSAASDVYKRQVSTQSTWDTGNVIAANTTIHLLQIKIDNLEDEAEEYKKRIKEMASQTEQQKHRYEDIMSHLRSQFKHTEEGKNKAEVENRLLKERVQSLLKKYEEDIEEIEIKHQREMKDLKEDVFSKGSKIESLNKFRLEREQYLEEIKNLREELDKEKQEHKKDLQSKERQLFCATEKLQKEMQSKISETKMQLMAVNDEQLSATTRLTILQNHQLTIELEYQSKQSEKLVDANKHLEEQISVFRRELEIQKQVQTEMARKSHYYQKLLHKLNQRLKDQEQTAIESKRTAEEQKVPDTEELISFLETKLEESEKKFSAFKDDYEVLLSLIHI